MKTCIPAAGAGALNVTVPVVGLPASTGSGAMLKEEIVIEGGGEVIVMVVVLLLRPMLADNCAVTLGPPSSRPVALTSNDPVVCPAGIASWVVDTVNP